MENKQIQVMRVSGNSMEPILSSGDRILVQKRAAYCVGDILVFDHEGSFLVHRLCYEIEGKCYFMGDNKSSVEAIEEKDILGKVVLINRNNIWYGVEKNGDYERIKSMLKLIKNKR